MSGPTQLELPASKKWNTYGLSIYISRKGVPLGTVDADALAEKARQVLGNRRGQPSVSMSSGDRSLGQ